MKSTYSRTEVDIFGEIFPEYFDSEGGARALQSAMRRSLTPIQKQILLLHYADKLSVSEIAKHRNVNPSTVSRTLHRAKENMQRIALNLGLLIDC